jgi:hypothetical protein
MFALPETTKTGGIIDAKFPSDRKTLTVALFSEIVLPNNN